MPVATFDTLKFANTLKAAGVPDKQAEAQAALFAEALQVNLKDLATKDDVAALGKATKDDVAALGKDLRHEMKELESKIGNKIDAAVAALTNAIDRAVSKSDNVRTELKGETFLLRSLGGIILGVAVAIAVKLFFYMPR